MKLDQDCLKKMARALRHTCLEEADCDECFESMDRFAEMILAGEEAAKVLPLIEEHLAYCDDCRDEYEALLTALRTTA